MKTIFLVLKTSLLLITINYSQTNKSIIIPHLEVKHTEGINLIYSSSFGLAWKNLEQQIFKENIKTEKKLDFVKIMNRSNPIEIEETKSVSLAGFVKDGIDKKIISELGNKFGKEIDLSEYTKDPFNIICYSYFETDIKFNTAFENFPNSTPFWGSNSTSDIYYFGIWTANNSDYHKKLRDQVKVYNFEKKGEFAISLSNLQDDCEIIMAVIKPDGILKTTISNTLKKIKVVNPNRLADNDRLLIPKIDFNLIKRYDQLIGVHLANEKFKEYFFSEALQSIGFKLDETGADANSEAKIVLKKGPGPGAIIINRPFLLMIKHKLVNEPYLVLWIENPELLVKNN